jgi:hypothetical protein
VLVDAQDLGAACRVPLGELAAQTALEVALHGTLLFA